MMLDMLLGCNGGVKLLEHEPELPDSETRMLDAACLARLIFLRNSSNFKDTDELMERNSKFFLVRCVILRSRCFMFFLASSTKIK